MGILQNVAGNGLSSAKKKRMEPGFGGVGVGVGVGDGKKWNGASTRAGAGAALCIIT